METYRPSSRASGRPLLYIWVAVTAFVALLFLGSSSGGLAGWAPLLLILLLCPFIHMFVHRGHVARGGANTISGKSVAASMADPVTETPVTRKRQAGKKGNRT